MDVNFRVLASNDQNMIWEMLMYAAHESSLETVMQLPELMHYAQDWGGKGDSGYGAFILDKPIGAAWVRQFIGEDPGYGYVSDEIPELAFAVHPDYRGQGIGTRLLQLLIAQVKIGAPGMSLSVRANNPAISLYERLNFQTLIHTEVVNRTGGKSFTMVNYF